MLGLLNMDLQGHIPIGDGIKQSFTLLKAITLSWEMVVFID